MPSAVHPQLASSDAFAPGSSERFTGAVQVGTIVEAPPGPALSLYEVFFTAGARTVWHAHEGEQILVGLSGKCIVHIQGEQARELTPGEAVRIASSVRHWHGAGAAAPASHLGVNESLPTAWGEPVTDEEYVRAVTEATGGTRA